MEEYLADLAKVLQAQWPDNRTVNIVCHGHSVPSGYFATPFVDTFNAYPHLLHVALKERFPFAVVNVITTAIGGEDSESGRQRMNTDVLCYRPDLVTIDYALNDRRIGLEKAYSAWASMIEDALAQGAKVILLTPTWDMDEIGRQTGQSELWRHAGQIRLLADRYGVSLADSYAAFRQYTDRGGDPRNLLSWTNHPNRRGHELVRDEIMRCFPNDGIK